MSASPWWAVRTTRLRPVMAANAARVVAVVRHVAARAAAIVAAVVATRLVVAVVATGVAMPMIAALRPRLVPRPRLARRALRPLRPVSRALRPLRLARRVVVVRLLRLPHRLRPPLRPPLCWTSSPMWCSAASFSAVA